MNKIAHRPTRDELVRRGILLDSHGRVALNPVINDEDSSLAARNMIIIITRIFLLLL